MAPQQGGSGLTGALGNAVQAELDQVDGRRGIARGDKDGQLIRHDVLSRGHERRLLPRAVVQSALPRVVLV